MSALYWALVVGYLLAAGILARVLPGAWRWPALLGVAAAGAVLLLPTRCESFPMPICVPGASPPVCEATTRCSTLGGLRVPYADAFGVAATWATGVVLLLAAVPVAVATGRRRRPARR